MKFTKRSLLVVKVIEKFLPDDFNYTFRETIYHGFKTKIIDTKRDNKNKRITFQNIIGICMTFFFSSIYVFY